MTNQDEIARRTALALKAIRKSVGTEQGEFGADLFVAHHLEEIEDSYWIERLQTSAPDASQVLSLLVLDPHWNEDDEDGLDTLDFTLPGGVSNYLLSVQFDEDGAVEDICMES